MILTLSFTLPLIKVEGNVPLWDTQALFAQIVEAVIASPLTPERIGAIAWGFIAALADAVQQFAVSHFATEKGSTQNRADDPSPYVVLCGGVFQNTVLNALCQQKLNACGMQVLSSTDLPVNDASIALGQLWYGLHHDHE